MVIHRFNWHARGRREGDRRTCYTKIDTRGRSKTTNATSATNKYTKIQLNTANSQQTHSLFNPLKFITQAMCLYARKLKLTHDTHTRTLKVQEECKECKAIEQISQTHSNTLRETCKECKAKTLQAVPGSAWRVVK